MNLTAKNSTNVQVRIQAGRHEIIADEPLGVGDDAGPDPYSLLLSSLAACTIMTVQMYAKRKKWLLEGIELRLSTHKVHAKNSINTNCGLSLDVRTSHPLNHQIVLFCSSEVLPPDNKGKINHISWPGF
jgi:uncharacterized OsmC-like protein